MAIIPLDQLPSKKQESSNEQSSQIIPIDQLPSKSNFSTLQDSTINEEPKNSRFEEIVNSPWATGVGMFGELSRREEGVFANIASDYLKKDLSFKDIFKSASEAITGKRVEEFGGVLKQLGADDLSASIGGLAMSAFLPSSFLMSGAGKGKTLAEKQAKNLFNAYTRTPNKAKNPLVHLSANFLSKDPRRVQQLLDNPEIYSPHNADSRNATIIAKKISRGIREIKNKSPEVLDVDPQIPIQIASKAIDDFDSMFNAIKKQHREVIRGVRGGKETIITANDLLDLSKTVDEATGIPFDVSELARKGMKGSGAEEAQNILKKFRNTLFEVSKGNEDQMLGKQPGLTIDNLINLREDLGNLLQGTYGPQGVIAKPGDKATSLMKILRRRISDVIQDKYPEIKDADNAFTKMSDIRTNLTQNSLSKKQQIANLISSKTRNESKLMALKDLDDVLPENNKVLQKISGYDELKASSLGERIKNNLGIDHNKLTAIEDRILRFDAIDTPGTQTQLLRELDSVLPDKYKFYEHLTRFDLARAFSKPGSIFKANASANLASGAIPEAKGVGILAGLVGTIPPAFAEAVKFSKSASDKIGNIRSKKPVRLGEAAILKQLLKLRDLI